MNRFVLFWGLGRISWDWGFGGLFPFQKESMDKETEHNGNQDCGPKFLV